MLSLHDALPILCKDLVEVLVVGSQPAVAGSAADEAVHGAEGTVARYRLVGGVLEKAQSPFCEPVGRDRSVAEVGREHERVVGGDLDRKSTRLNSSHSCAARMPSSA